MPSPVLGFGISGRRYFQEPSPALPFHPGPPEQSKPRPQNSSAAKRCLLSGDSAGLSPILSSTPLAHRSSRRGLPLGSRLACPRTTHTGRPPLCPAQQHSDPDLQSPSPASMPGPRATQAARHTVTSPGCDFAPLPRSFSPAAL